MKGRTYNQILTDVDNCGNLWLLENLRAEIAENTKEYSLVQMEFAVEHMLEAKGRIESFLTKKK